MSAVFEGIRVLEVGDSPAVAIAGQYLADYGARVTRLEPAAPDRVRRSQAARAYHRGKSSLLADIETIEGRRELQASLEESDVLLLGASPVTLTGPGLDYAALAARQPALVYALISPLGTEGPYAGVDGGEDVANALNGHSGTQAAFEGPPVYMVSPVAAHAAGVATAGAIAVALLHRRRTGLGQRIDMSMLAGGLLTFPDGIVRRDGRNTYADIGVERYPLGTWPLFRVYETADGYLVLGVATERLWFHFALFVDHPEWIGDPRLEGAPWAIGSEGRAFLQAELTALFRTRRSDEWLTSFRSAGVPAAPILGGSDFLQSEHVAANEMCIEVADPDIGPTGQVGPPIRFHRPPAVVCGGAPHAGERRPVTPRIAWPAPAADGLSGHPLSGVKVLNLSGHIAGSYGPTLLADLGADVVKVESKDGDAFRPLGLGFAVYNRGQRVMVLDLKRPEAHEIVLVAARETDVVVENFRLGTAARLGLDYETLSAVNPRLIYLTASGYGSRGPRAGEAGFDALFQGEAGFMRAQGGPDGPPVMLCSSVCDFTTGLLGAVAVMFGLWEREISGRGQHIETSLMNAALAIRTGDLVLSPNVPARRSGGRDLRGLNPLQRFYPAADGWVFVDASTPERYASLAACVLPSAAHPPYDLALAEAVDGPLAAALTFAFNQATVAHALACLAAAGVPAVPVVPASGALAHEQVIANRLVDTRCHPNLGVLETAFGMPRFAAMPSTTPLPAPMTAEHTVEILGELGLEQPRIAELLARGIAVQGSLEEERGRFIMT